MSCEKERLPFPCHRAGPWESISQLGRLGGLRIQLGPSIHVRGQTRGQAVEEAGGRPARIEPQGEVLPEAWNGIDRVLGRDDDLHLRRRMEGPRMTARLPGVDLHFGGADLGQRQPGGIQRFLQPSIGIGLGWP